MATIKFSTTDIKIQKSTYWEDLLILGKNLGAVQKVITNDEGVTKDKSEPTEFISL